MILQHVDDGYAHCYRGVRGKMLSEVSTVLEGRRERRRERKNSKDVPSDMGDLNCNQFL